MKLLPTTLKPRKVKFDAGALALNLIGYGTIAFFLLPLVVVILISFTSGNSIGFPPELPLSLKWYKAFFEDPLFRHSLVKSLQIAGMTIALSVPLGTAAAIGFTQRRFRGEDIVYFLLFLPFLVPGIVLGIGLLMSLEPLGIGFMQNFPYLGSSPIVVIGHSLWATPLAFLVMVAVLRGMDPALRDAAMSLGATPLRTFFEITLPLTRAGLLAAVILAFVVSFHEFVMAAFLTSAEDRTLPVRIFDSLRFEVRPIIAAIDSLMIFSVLVALILIGRLIGIEKIRMR